MSVLSVSDFIRVTNAFSDAQTRAEEIKRFYYDTAYNVVVLQSFDPEVDLLLPFYSSYQFATTIFESPAASVVSAVRSLNKHILNRARTNSGDKFTDINDWIDAGGTNEVGTNVGRLGDSDISIAVSQHYADLSSKSGFAIATRNIQVEEAPTATIHSSGLLVPSTVTFSTAPYSGVANDVIGDIALQAWIQYNSSGTILNLLDEASIPTAFSIDFQNGHYVEVDDWTPDVAPGELIFQGFHIAGDGLDNPVVPVDAQNVNFIVRVTRLSVGGVSGQNEIVDGDILLYAPDADGDSANLADSTTAWPYSATTSVYAGGKWGHLWSVLSGSNILDYLGPTEINNNRFGVIVRPERKSSSYNGDAVPVGRITGVTLEITWN